MFKQVLAVTSIVFISAVTIYSQPVKPKLIVGIVVDQMRPDYLTKFYGQFGENGFKRLMKEGFVCNNTHIDYSPTVTGPGHASIYSGTTPKYHGIVENDWYNRNSGAIIYCADDTTVQSIGNQLPTNKTFSARNLLATNISDELKLASNGKSKVIAMSLKDRGATLPAGHMANGAFWFDQKTGNFISSTYYMQQLPDWVSRFNAQKYAQQYQEKQWDLLMPESSYPLSIADDNPYETKFPGKLKPVFPYNLAEISVLKKTAFYGIYASPYGNSILADLAIEAIKNAELGTDEFTDILAVSFSSTDVVGHLFGPQSKEVNDTYLRLDRDIARFLEILDQKVGKGNYTLFLTADHGAGEIPSHMHDLKIPAGYIDTSAFVKDIKSKLSAKFGIGNWIECYISGMFYLNHHLIKAKKLNLEEVQNYLADMLRNKEGIAEAYTATQLTNNEYCEGIGQRVQKGFYFNRCGDVILVLMPNWNEQSSYSATHGSPYDFDTHIPLIWFGAGISKGQNSRHYNITDIAPTVSAMLGIKNPGSCIGSPIEEIFTQK